VLDSGLGHFGCHHFLYAFAGHCTLPCCRLAHLLGQQAGLAASRLPCGLLLAGKTHSSKDFGCIAGQKVLLLLLLPLK
jgi:hypothetical protein